MTWHGIDNKSVLSIGMRIYLITGKRRLCARGEEWSASDWNWISLTGPFCWPPAVAAGAYCGWLMASDDSVRVLWAERISRRLLRFAGVAELVAELGLAAGLMGRQRSSVKWELLSTVYTTLLHLRVQACPHGLSRRFCRSSPMLRAKCTAVSSSARHLAV